MAMHDNLGNRVIRLRSYPAGFPQPSDFELVEEVVPEPGEGELVVQTIYLSIDPYLRLRLREEGVLDGEGIMGGQLPIGAVVPGRGVGIVRRSRDEGFAEGDIVSGELAWADFVRTDGRMLVKIDPKSVPLRHSQGILGGVGMTAYFATLDAGRPRVGDTVVVSAAAGGVGILAGQVARIAGARVVGIAGGLEKTRLLIREAGFDAAVDYKAESWAESLAKACPTGIDVFLDLVGGAIHDRVMEHINVGARIVLVGIISRYAAASEDHGPRHLYRMIMKRAVMRGFLVGDYMNRFPEARTAILGWLHEGRIKPIETVMYGLENAPAAFAGLLAGRNVGKLLVQVSPEPAGRQGRGERPLAASAGGASLA
jgi:NADPH-dependent curcumin reductase CurA